MSRQDVVGFNVSVDDVPCVDVLHGQEKLQDDSSGCSGLDRSPFEFDEGIKISACCQFHEDVPVER